MFTGIYDTFIRLICFAVLTRMLLLILPGKKYDAYMKLLIGFCMMIILITNMNQLLFGYKFSENSDWRMSVNKSDTEKIKFQEYAEICESSTLSTVEDEIKTKLNKELITDNIVIKSVNILICRDVDSVDYGKIEGVMIEAKANVDKSVNITVNKIIVEQTNEKSDNLKKNGIIKKIRSEVADMLGIEEECVRIA